MSRQSTTIDAALSRPLTTQLDEAQRLQQQQQPPAAAVPPQDKVAEVPRDQSQVKTRLADDEKPRQGRGLDPLLDKLGLVRTKDGSVRFSDRFSLRKLSSIRAQAAATGPLPPEATLPVMGPLPLVDAPINAVALESFASALGRGIDDILAPPQVGGGFIGKVTNDSLTSSLNRIREGSPLDFTKLSADSLTAVFMKLNIDNPLDSVQMQNQLDEAMSKMRQLAIDEAKAKIAVMKKLLEELANAAIGGFFLVAIIIAIIIAIIVALLFSIIIAIIVAIVLIVAAMVVKQMLKAKAEKAIEEGCKKAMADAMIQIDQKIAEEREKALKQMAEASLVGPDGKPIKSPAIRAAVQDDLAIALGKVVDIAKNQGMEAATAQGPQLIHDSIMPDLLGLGIPQEKADLLAWAITEESMKNLANTLQPPGSVPVDAAGKQLTDAEIKARLEPKLTAALAQVTAIADAEGGEAAAARGPQVIHDALLDELKAMGLSDEYADKYAWAIAAEAMNEIADRVGMANPQPNTGTTTPTDPSVPATQPDPEVPPASAPGRRPGDITAGAGGFTALMASAMMDDLAPQLMSLLPDARAAELMTAISSGGAEQALRNAIDADDALTPTAMLAMTAVVSGAFGDADLNQIFANPLDPQSLASDLAAAKDRALEALLQVGGHSQEAEARLQRPFNV